jgi:hypothetical protein
MRFNSRGQATGECNGGAWVATPRLAERYGGPGGVDIAVLAPDGRSAGWLTDDEIGCVRGYAIVALPIGGGAPRVLDDAHGGANWARFGGGRFGAWLGGHAYGAVDLMDANVLDTGPDGTVAVQHTPPWTGFELHAPDGTVTVVPDVRLAQPSERSLRVVHATGAIWIDQTGTIHHVGLGPAQPAQVGPAGRPCTFMVGDVRLIAYWSERYGVVAHPMTDASRGVVLFPPSEAFGVDAVAPGTVIRGVCASGEGELPSDARFSDVDLATTAFAPFVPTAPAPPPAPVDLPAEPPALARIGTRLTACYPGNFGLQLSAPGNALMIGSRADMGQMLAAGDPRLILAYGVAGIDVTASEWARVYGVLVDGESGGGSVRDNVAANAAAARARMATLGLAPRPILSYQQDVLERIPGVDLPLLQSYWDHEPPPSEYSTWLSAALATIGMPFGICAQAHDRRRTHGPDPVWSDAALSRLQARHDEALRHDGCAGIVWFAFKREGALSCDPPANEFGPTQQPTELRWVQAICAACDAPTIVQAPAPAPDPEPPPPPVEPPPVVVQPPIVPEPAPAQKPAAPAQPSSSHTALEVGGAVAAAAALIVAIVRARQQQTGTYPTSEQIIAALPRDADGNLAIDDVWDAANPK